MSFEIAFNGLCKDNTETDGMDGIATILKVTVKLIFLP